MSTPKIITAVDLPARLAGRYEAQLTASLAHAFPEADIGVLYSPHATDTRGQIAVTYDAPDDNDTDGLEQIRAETVNIARAARGIAHAVRHALLHLDTQPHLAYDPSNPVDLIYLEAPTQAEADHARRALAAAYRFTAISTTVTPGRGHAYVHARDDAWHQHLTAQAWRALYMAALEQRRTAVEEAPPA